MKNQKCIVCGTEFTPRRGKLFCTDKCKQLHYRSQDDPESLTYKIIEDFKEAGKLEKLDIDLLKKIYLLEKKPIWEIDVNEYKAFCLKYEECNICDYALKRKNLTGLVTLEQIKEYFDLFKDSGGSDYPFDEKEYNEFIALITSGLVEFYYGDNYKT